MKTILNETCDVFHIFSNNENIFNVAVTNSYGKFEEWLTENNYTCAYFDRFNFIEEEIDPIIEDGEETGLYRIYFENSI